MAEKYNILEIMQEPGFKEVLHQEYLFRLSQNTTPSRVASYFEDKPDQLYDFMLNFVECILLGTNFPQFLGFKRKDAQTLHNRVLLPAVGTYLDQKRGIKRPLSFIPNTDTTRTYEAFHQMASGQCPCWPDSNAEDNPQ